ncbi:hypothetical protein A2U01_0114560, partial [Trifolium medium]|nr:hypothetical protein [Trifolium medium]
MCTPFEVEYQYR